MYLAFLASNAKESENYIRPLRELKRLRSKDDTLTQEEEDQLLNGMWYLNIHSTTYPAGELRGQVE